MGSGWLFFIHMKIQIPYQLIQFTDRCIKCIVYPVDLNRQAINKKAPDTEA